MGEVYRARDPRLDRTVAVKVLPAHLSATEETRQRFEREARTISQLSHPHICAVYDVGSDRGIEYLVLEYLEGETLADRLGRGALPLEQVFRFGAEIADALDKAHRRGIVHRDLKPGNVMLTKSGVKLLDFGLAKAVLAQGPAANLSTFPTQGPALTAEGTILGTLQYMAPEQLEGRETDARTDIFAFGALLYEMATARRAFSGRSQASLIGAILRDEAPSVSKVEPLAPSALDRIIRTCLAKDPEDRFQTAHDVRLELQWASSPAAEPAGDARVAGRRGRERLAWALVALLAAGLAVALPLALRGRLRPEPRTRALKFSIVPPENWKFQPGMFALSRDGGRLAYVATGAKGTSLLWIRPFDSVEARPLAGTEGASGPFWSPDGRSLGFFADGKLKKIEAAGGPPRTLAEARVGRGGTWGPDGTIVFAPDPTAGLSRVSAEGGPAVPQTLLDVSRQENSHRWPAFLPDGRHFLYFARSRQRENLSVCVASLDSKEIRRLLFANSNAVFAPPAPGSSAGYLLFQREGWLTAQKLDLAGLKVEGEPVPIAEKVKGSDPATSGSFSVSESGVLAYSTAPSAATAPITWMDRDGKASALIPSPGQDLDFAISPDQKRVVMDVLNTEIGGREIWQLDLSRGVASRLSLGSAEEMSPVWSPDGTRITFAAKESNGPWDLYERPSSGGGDRTPLLKSEIYKFPDDWSPDGRVLLYESLDPKTGRDIWMLRASGDRRPAPLLQTPFNESQATFSPDGRFFAYVSDESGRAQVYVQTFPLSALKWQVSAEGGSQPKWRRDGKEMFYLAPDGQVMAVPISAGPSFEAGTPKALFRTQALIPRLTVAARGQYVVSADGQRFLVQASTETASAAPITVVLDWTADLKT